MAKNPDAYRESNLRRRYGITLAEYKALFEKQGNRCRICETDEAGGPGKASNTFLVDHCHKTGVIRGILCHRCNVMLGRLQDDPNQFQKYADYLRGNL